MMREDTLSFFSWEAWKKSISFESYFIEIVILCTCIDVTKDTEFSFLNFCLNSAACCRIIYLDDSKKELLTWHPRRKISLISLCTSIGHCKPQTRPKHLLACSLRSEHFLVSRIQNYSWFLVVHLEFISKLEDEFPVVKR